MDIVEQIKESSRRAMPTIVLSEGEDPRIIQGAARAVSDGLAKVSLIADPKIFEAVAGDVEGAERLDIHQPEASRHLAHYTQTFLELRRHKGLDTEGARQAMLKPLGFAAMMVRSGDADGTIGGAVATTADTVRTALQVIGRAANSKTVSSFFLMLLKQPVSRPVVFADCGLIIQPEPHELASIAIASAHSFRAMTGEEPRVALLSFSTKGSAKDASIDRIQEALKLIQEQAPALIVDGEIQFDAAIMPDIALKKAPGSPLSGQANVFVFPSLEAGNIGYKIAERIGGAVALGPILQGLSRPANDLSRGCSADDVYQMIAVTGAQIAAQKSAE